MNGAAIAAPREGACVPQSLLLLSLVSSSSYRHPTSLRQLGARGAQRSPPTFCQLPLEKRVCRLPTLLRLASSLISVRKSAQCAQLRTRGRRVRQTAGPVRCVGLSDCRNGWWYFVRRLRTLIRLETERPGACRAGG